MYDFKPPYHGAAYYPESWPREQIDEDLDHLVRHGLNMVRVAEFAWAVMEPEEGRFDLSLFREVVDKCKARGIAVVMCTPSATPPSWMEHRYPEVLQEVGFRKFHHGHRRMSCPTSPRFREFCARITEVMAKEFASDENIVGWQIDNEVSVMSGHGGIGCTCPTCVAEWHNYLRRTYGTVEKLNDAWGHYTWSVQFTDFEEILPPDEHMTLFPAHRLAWAEYKNYIWQDFVHAQADILHRYTKAPIGTDMMPTQQLDWAGTNSKLDVLQMNHYSGPSFSYFYFDFLRALKSDRPFWVTETSCCWNGSNEPCGPRKRGFAAANTLSAFALGANTVSYWLFRSHWGGWEMAHGSVIDAWGRSLQAGDEVCEISRTLDTLRPMLEGTRVSQSGLAINYGHIPHFISEYAAMTTEKKDYRSVLMGTVANPLCHAGYRPDVIAPSADLSPYKMIISTMQYTLEEGGFLDRILDWVEAGGTWVVGPMTDIFTKDCAKYKNAPFGHLEDWANIRRAFYAPAPSPRHWYAGPLPAGDTTGLVLDDGTEVATVNWHYDALEAGEGVRVRATYAAGGDDYLPGYAAITETKRGKGRIIVMGCQPDEAGFRRIIGDIAAECGVAPVCEGSDTLLRSLRTGAFGEVLCAVETKCQPATLKMPFAATDLLTGAAYAAGEVVELAPYGYLFAKKA